MWLIGLWFGALLLFVAVRYVAGRNQGLEIRRRELVILRADLESLVEEGEIFREDESYQILNEHINALLPVVKGWRLRKLVKTIGSTRFHREVMRIGSTGRAKESVLVNTPEIKV